MRPEHYPFPLPLFFLVPLMAVAQGAPVVSAPVLEGMTQQQLTQDIKTYAETAAQTAKLRESHDILKKTADAMEFVSDQVFNLGTTYRIMEKQVSLIGHSERVLKALSDNETVDPGIVTAYVDAVNKILLNAEEEVRLMNELLTSGVFNMSDNGRLEILDKIEAKMSQKLEHIHSIDRSFKRMDYEYYIYERYGN